MVNAARAPAIPPAADLGPGLEQSTGPARSSAPPVRPGRRRRRRPSVPRRPDPSLRSTPSAWVTAVIAGQVSGPERPTSSARQPLASFARRFLGVRRQPFMEKRRSHRRARVPGGAASCRRGHHRRLEALRIERHRGSLRPEAVSAASSWMAEGRWSRIAPYPGRGRQRGRPTSRARRHAPWPTPGDGLLDWTAPRRRGEPWRLCPWTRPPLPR